MLRVILTFYEHAIKALSEGASITDIVKAKVKERIARMKYVPENKFEKEYKEIVKQIEKKFKEMVMKK